MFTSHSTTMVKSLFSPVRLGAFQLRHGVIMAPLTRMRAAQPGDLPNETGPTYYGQRASEGGLLISEGTQVSPFGKGYPATPGIYSPEQTAGWKKVTEAVHARGGLIVAQLWHVGRISHAKHQPGGVAPVSASAIKPEGQSLTGLSNGMEWEDFQTPRALELSEIASIVAEYRRGAENAKAAGFDGVELHSANGFLLDQFLQDGCNRRTDRYGGSPENRSRLLLEVVEAVAGVFGSDRVGVRLSPYGTYNDMRDSDPSTLFSTVLRLLSPLGLAYVHLIEPRSTAAGVTDSPNGLAPRTAELFRRSFDGAMISAGGYDRQSAMDAVAQGLADAIAFGRLFISNPDLPHRLRLGAPLTPYDRSTFYGGAEKGYIDYPSLELQSLELRRPA